MLKICSWPCARSAMTLDTGFMMAASAEMGRRCTALPEPARCSARSITTMLPEPDPDSHTQMYLSDSIDVVPNLMWPSAMPSAGSCKMEGGGKAGIRESRVTKKGWRQGEWLEARLVWHSR